MAIPFRAYDGDAPYVFISYAHADEAAVMTFLRDMHARGYRIWYDEGIDAGTEWTESIAAHLYGASLVLAFLSPAYLASDNCRKELHYALTKKKNTVSIFLEQTQLSPGMEMQLGNVFALMKYSYPSEDYFYAKLYDAPLLQSAALLEADGPASPSLPAEPGRRKTARVKGAGQLGKKRRARRILAVVAALVVVGCAAAALIVFHFTGYLERWTTQTVAIETPEGDTVASFQNALLEQAARDYTGIASGEITVADLYGLTALYIDGESYSLTALPENGDGAQGSISDLSDLAYFTSLTAVYLRNQSITSLETLPACGIELLDISGNRVTALEGIENLPNLQTLVADGNAVSDLTGLERCLELRAVSLEGANASDLSAFRPLTRLQSLAISNATLAELGVALHQDSLTSVALYDCDLRGAFFKSFDRERGIETLTLVRCQLDSGAGLADFTGLERLTVADCTGSVDWSELTELAALETVTVSGDQAEEIQDLGLSAAVTEE